MKSSVNNLVALCSILKSVNEAVLGGLMSASTKRLMVLSPRQLDTAKAWFSFLGRDIIEVDKAMLERINNYETTVLTDRECSIFMRWWNYLPCNLIEDRDKDLYDTIREFLYND